MELTIPQLQQLILQAEAHLQQKQAVLHGLVQKAQEFKDSIAPESKEVEVLPPDSPDEPSAITPNHRVD